MRRLQLIGKIAVGVLWKFRYFIVLNRKIASHGLLLLSSSARFQLDKGSRARVGNRSTLESGTLVAVRTGGRLTIGNNVYLNRQCTVVVREEVILEDGVTIGPNCCVYDHDHDITNRGGFVSKPIIIKKNAWIGAGCIILKGVTVGENAIVSAGCVVAKDVPSNTILIQKRNSEYHSIL